MDRIGRSLDNLFGIIDDLTARNERLVCLVSQLVTGGSRLMQAVTTINSVFDLIDHICSTDCDYILVVTEGSYQYLDREDIDRMLGDGTLGCTLGALWKAETVAIVLP